MGDEKDDLPYFATCTHCGMQTGLSFKQLENNQPLKCRVCGAPLKIVPPPKRPAKKRKKRPCDYYLLYAERVEYERRFDGEYSDTDEFSRGALLGQLIVLIIALVVSFALFIVALISTC